MLYREQAFVSIVCYLRDDADAVEGFLHQVGGQLTERFEYVEFVLVDDYSGDQTLEIARKALDSLRYSGSLIRLSQRHGVERALFAGLDKAIGDYVFEFQSPCLDFDPALLSDLFEAVKSRHDIVSLEPDARQSIGSRLFYFLFNKYSYITQSIGRERGLLLSRRALNFVLNVDERIRYKKALLALSGFRRTSIRYAVSSRCYRDSRTLGEKIDLAVGALISYTGFGSQVSVGLSVMFLMVSILIGLYAVVSYFSRADIAYGWTSLILFLSIGFSGVFLILGVLSEYVSKVIREVVNFPMYTVEHSSAVLNDRPAHVDPDPARAPRGAAESAIE